MTQTLIRKWPSLIGLAILFAAEFLLRDLLLPIPASGAAIATATAVEWLLLIALLAIWIPRVEGLRLDSIGMGRFRWRHLAWGSLGYLLAMILLAFSGLALEALGLPSIRSLQPMIRTLGAPVLVSLFFTGTFLEEVFYRGYLIERVTWLTGRRWPAALLSWFLFTVVHLRFFGPGPTVDVSILSAALVLLYLREKSIWPCVVLHGINDLLGFLIFPLLLQG